MNLVLELRVDGHWGSGLGRIGLLAGSFVPMIFGGDSIIEIISGYDPVRLASSLASLIWACRLFV